MIDLSTPLYVDLFFNWSNAKIKLLKRLLNAIQFFFIHSLFFPLLMILTKYRFSCQIKNPRRGFKFISLRFLLLAQTVGIQFLILQQY